MKKLIAVLLCVLVLFSAVSVTCFAEYPVEGRDEPSVETAVENTIGKYIPTGKVVADNFFNVLDAIRSAGLVAEVKTTKELTAEAADKIRDRKY